MKTKIPLYIRLPFILSIIVFCFYTFSGGNTQTLLHPITIGVTLLSTLLLFIFEALNKLVETQKLSLLPKKEREKIIQAGKINYFVKLYKSALFDPKEEEQEEKPKEIDHGFDGIIELDNKLPTWWVNLFYLTIVFAVLYFFAYLITDFAHPEKEYELAYHKQMEEVAAYEKAMPQATLETAFFDENLIEQGKELFRESCAICHGPDGEGNIGPNLRDEYWINHPEKTLFKNIFNMVWNGSKNNPTMRAFGASGEIKGNDIQKISSYVYSINKDPKRLPNAKAPEGELVIWENESNL